MTVKQEKLIDRVRKLIAKANGTDSQAEADLFMTKANKMLLEHNLTMTEVGTDEEGGHSIEEIKQAAQFGSNKSEGNKWETLLMGVLCAHNMCDSIIHTKRHLPGGSISVIGSRENAETVLYLFDVAREMIRRLSKEAYKQYREEILDGWSGEADEKSLLKMGQLAYRMPWIRNYLKGAVLGLNEKLQSQKKDIMSEAGEATGEKFELMVVDNKQAIELYKEKKYPKLSKTRAATIADKGAYDQGKTDGKNINLNKGISGTEKTVPKQLN